MIHENDMMLLDKERISFSFVIFLERFASPTSWTGTNIPIVLLIITNKRWVFLHLTNGSPLLKFRPHILAFNFEQFLELVLPLGNLSDAGKKGAEKLLKKGVEKLFGSIMDIGIPNEDLDLVIKHENSFVINVEDLIDIEKFGGTNFQLIPRILIYN